MFCFSQLSSLQPQGLFVEWAPTSEWVNDGNNSTETNGNKSDAEWAVINTVGYKNNKDQQPGESLVLSNFAL